MTGQTVEEDLREFARVLVQAGLGTSGDRLVQMTQAVAAEMPHTDAEVLARAWLVAAARQWRSEAAGWAPGTDHDRTAAAFEECRAHDLVVLEGVDGPGDLSQLSGPDRTLRGVAWFTNRSVWDAIADGVLVVELRHPDSRPVAEGEHLLTAMLTCLERHAVRARFHEGRVEVATRWRRRPA